jgi:hypothetical protein
MQRERLDGLIHVGFVARLDELEPEEAIGGAPLPQLQLQRPLQILRLLVGEITALDQRQNALQRLRVENGNGVTPSAGARWPCRVPRWRRRTPSASY